MRIEEMMEARALLARHPELSPRDAVHAASMKLAGISRIYSYDKAFSRLRFLERLEPSASRRR